MMRAIKCPWMELTTIALFADFIEKEECADDGWKARGEKIWCVVFPDYQ